MKRVDFKKILDFVSVMVGPRGLEPRTTRL